MLKTVIIIPSRMSASRLPNKPLKTINNKEMIVHVFETAKRANIGEVVVATPDKEILDLINGIGGKALITKNDHKTGTDRIFEVFNESYKDKAEIIINLQGDMPNIKPEAIIDLNNYMQKKQCDVGTLAGDLISKHEYEDPNVVKVSMKARLLKGTFQNASDFFRQKNNDTTENIYHHVGIYGFTSRSLMRYVNLKRSKLEKERKLEQLRILENGMNIHVGYLNSLPLSVDTEKDLINIKKIMENDKK